MNKKLQVKCPQCNKNFDYYSVKTRPFCSERCKMVDLGHWLSENYTLPSNEKLSEEDIETIIQASEPNNGPNHKDE